jgi:uncharacterized protein (TIGR00269 family)
MKVKATVSRYRMLSFDDKIAVAVSGGKDSVALLHVLAGLERKQPNAGLFAVTVDEGIKGYRDEALEIASENAEQLGVPHVVVSFKELFGVSLDEIVARRKKIAHAGVTSCAVCGVLRRRALNLAARRIGADKLVTAHTLDDEVQTVLLNLFHGDVWRLAKEKPFTDFVHEKFVRRVKPFCLVPERETALYALVKGVRFQGCRCPYASEALRNDVRGMLNRLEEKHSGVKFTIFNSVERIRPALELTAKEEGLGECSVCGEPSTMRVCRTCQLLREFREL